MSSPTATSPVVGVGFDTARYGHHLTFLREDRQPAAKPLEFLETRSGYQALEQRLSELARKQPGVEFQIRVDAAGQYATNLLAFLHQLPWPKSISVGDPLRGQTLSPSPFSQEENGRRGKLRLRPLRRRRRAGLDTAVVARTGEPPGSGQPLGV